MSLSQFGTHVKPADALRVASSIFSEGVTHLHAGRLAEALANFEASLSMNQNFLQPAALESINCYHQIASVHDKLGNLSEAASYYERARAQLASAPIPPGERGVFAKRRRNELLKQVQQRLDMMPRITQVPKVGAGVPLADLRKLYDSLLSSGDQQLAAGDLSGAELAFEQVRRSPHAPQGDRARQREWCGGQRGDDERRRRGRLRLPLPPRRGPSAERSGDGSRGTHCRRHRRADRRRPRRRPWPLK